MISPPRFNRLGVRNGPEIVPTPPSFDLPPPIPLPAGDTSDSATPNVLALLAQASSDLARESWEMRDGPTVKKLESGKESPGDQEGRGEGTTWGPLRVTFRGALVEVAAVEHRAGPEVLQVLSGRLGGLWEVGFQGPAGREAAQARTAGWRGAQVRSSIGSPLGARSLVPRCGVRTRCRPHREGRAALGVHAGSGS